MMKRILSKWEKSKNLTLAADTKTNIEVVLLDDSRSDYAL